MKKSILLKRVSYATDAKEILRGVSLAVAEGDCFCLFGENGAGKSTLFKIIAGELKPDEGSVHHTGHLRFTMVPQEFHPHTPEETIDGYTERVAGVQYMKKVAELSKRLGYPTARHGTVATSALSGGQQKIVALSVALAQKPDFLLLDEPENHLDIVSRAELVDMLAEFGGGLLLVSHDRFVIDALSTHVGELADGVLHTVEGGYSEYLEEKMSRIEGLQRTYDAEQKRIEQLRKSLVVMKQKAIRGNDVAQYKRRLAEFEALKSSHKENARPSATSTKIHLRAADSALYAGKLVLSITDASFNYPGRPPLFKKTHLDVYSGTTTVLLGRNGAGKSTFLKCLKGDLTFTTGGVKARTGVRIAFFDQHAAFAPGDTALQIVRARMAVGETDAKAALGAMRFDSARMTTPSSLLSGGERMRVRFALAFGQKPDLLVLDEPTNHIDEVTWEILVHACRDYTGTLLLVTHDHEFIEEVKPDLFWMFKDGTLVERHKDLSVLLEELQQ